jgi:hypothetical protein
MIESFLILDEKPNVFVVTDNPNAISKYNFVFTDHINNYNQKYTGYNTNYYDFDFSVKRFSLLFAFENGLQHKLFQETLMDQGFTVPIFPLIDINIDNIDDWLLAHQVEHQAFAGLLGLNNPFNLLDVDVNREDDWYDWVASHLYIHQQIAASLNLT